MTPADLNKHLGASGLRIAIAVTGGGVMGVAELLAAGGASAWLEEVRVPYCREAFDAIASISIDRYVSAVAAEALARGVWRPGTVGVGITAKLTTGDAERPGREHRAYACIFDGKPRRAMLALRSTTREQQEMEAAEFVQTTLECVPRR